MSDLTPESLLDQIQPIFRQALDNPALTVSRSSSAVNTQNWDSLVHIEIIEMVERRFRVRFGLGELQDLKTVGDLIDLTLRKSSALGH
jgi:acyl carrier protein